MVKLLIGMTGASGAIYGIRLLEVLRGCGAETHLVVTGAAEEIVKRETDRAPEDVKRLASRCYGINELDAPIASGSFITDGMVVIPCSMKTLAGIASGYSDNLLLRAADVTLKEGRPLILVTRETPLNLIHIKNMLLLALSGAVILPACPGFYHKPKGVEDLVDFIVYKVLDLLRIESGSHKRLANVGSN